jgi:hypothetical protein
MDEQEKKVLSERFAKLPKRLQDAVTSIHTGEIIADIAKSKKMTVAQAYSLYNETMFILYGLENPDDFYETLQRQLGMTAEDAKDVIVEINNRIVAPIREDLATLYKTIIDERAPKSGETRDIGALSRVGLQNALGETSVTPTASPNVVIANTASPAGQTQSADQSVPNTTNNDVVAPKKDLVSSNLTSSETGQPPINNPGPATPDPYREPI